MLQVRPPVEPSCTTWFSPGREVWSSQSNRRASGSWYSEDWKVTPIPIPSSRLHQPEPTRTAMLFSVSCSWWRAECRVPFYRRCWISLSLQRLHEQSIWLLSLGFMEHCDSERVSKAQERVATLAWNAFYSPEGQSSCNRRWGWKTLAVVWIQVSAGCSQVQARQAVEDDSPRLHQMQVSETTPYMSSVNRQRCYKSTMAGCSSETCWRRQMRAR